MTIGETIRIFRDRAGLTQAELAKLIGVSVGTILNYEKDKTVPDILTLGLIMKVLRIESKDMFHTKGDLYEPGREPLVLYCPDDGFELDDDGIALCKSLEITSNIFRLYGCRKYNYSCVKINDTVYLMYNDVEIEPGNMAFVRFSGSKYFVIASFDGEKYTDIFTKETTDKIDAIAARVLGVVDEYQVHEKEE